MKVLFKMGRIKKDTGISYFIIIFGFILFIKGYYLYK
jgi:hypothetical protein